MGNGARRIPDLLSCATDRLARKVVGVNLSELIDTHRGGRSYTELSRDCGGSPTDKRLQQMVRTQIKNFPDPVTVVALAKGLRVSQSAIVLASAESLGLDVRTSTPRLLELLPVSAARLTEPQAAALAHLVRTFVEVEAPGRATPAKTGTDGLAEAGPQSPARTRTRRQLEELLQRARAAGAENVGELEQILTEMDREPPEAGRRGA